MMMVNSDIDNWNNTYVWSISADVHSRSLVSLWYGASHRIGSCRRLCVLPQIGYFPLIDWCRAAAWNPPMKNASSYYLFALKKLFFSRRFVLVFWHFHAYSLNVSFMVLLLQDCANRIKHAQHNGHNYFFSWEYELTKDLKVIDDHYDFVDDDDEDGHIHSDCTAHKVDWITGRNICRRHCMDLVSIETRSVITVITVITIVGGSSPP